MSINVVASKPVAEGFAEGTELSAQRREEDKSRGRTALKNEGADGRRQAPLYAREDRRFVAEPLGASTEVATPEGSSNLRG